MLGDMENFAISERPLLQLRRNPRPLGSRVACVRVVLLAGVQSSRVGVPSPVAYVKRVDTQNWDGGVLEWCELHCTPARKPSYWARHPVLNDLPYLALAAPMNSSRGGCRAVYCVGCCSHRRSAGSCFFGRL